MSFLQKRDKPKHGAHKAVPMFDPYGQWSGAKKKGFGLAKKKDPHLVLPGVTHYESLRLRNVKDYVEKETGKPCTLPQHLIEDVYSMYVNTDVKRKSTTKGTALKAKVLDRTYNSFTKILTQDAPVYSQLLTRELAIYMQEVQRQLEEEEEKQQKQQSGNGGEGDQPGHSLTKGDSPGVFDDKGDEEGEGEEGEGEGGPESGDSNSASKSNASAEHGQPDLDKALDDILDRTERNLEKAINKAESKMKEIKDSLGEEALKELGADPSFLDNIESVREKLKRISINKNSIKTVLGKILNESTNYFSLNYKKKKESLLEANDFDVLVGLEYLNPIFKNALINEPYSETKLYKGKIDLYLDCSGSMGSSSRFEGQSIRMIELVKGIAITLHRMKMLDKLYFFDTSLYEVKDINEFTILNFNKSGGTNFNKVVKQCQINGRNSVVITDGQDYCNDYIKNVFWVGVGGTDFNSGYGGGGAFELYRKNRQCVAYQNDGVLKYV